MVAQNKKSLLQGHQRYVKWKDVQSVFVPNFHIMNAKAIFSEFSCCCTLSMVSLMTAFGVKGGDSRVSSNSALCCEAYAAITNTRGQILLAYAIVYICLWKILFHTLVHLDFTSHFLGQSTMHCNVYYFIGCKSALCRQLRIWQVWIVPLNPSQWISDLIWNDFTWSQLTDAGIEQHKHL